MKPTWIIILILISQSNPALGQINGLIQEKYSSHLENYRFEEAGLYLDSLAESGMDRNMTDLLRGELFLKQYRFDSTLYYLNRIDTNSLSNGDLAQYFYQLSFANGYANMVDEDIAQKIRAKELWILAGDPLMANKVNYDLFYSFKAQDGLYDEGVRYLREFYENAMAGGSEEDMIKAYLSFATLMWSPEKLDSVQYYFDKADKLINKESSSKLKAIFHQYKGLYYSMIPQLQDSAYFFLKSSLQIFIDLGLDNQVYNGLKNLAELERLQGNHSHAISILEAADTIPITVSIDDQKAHQYYYMAADYAAISDFENAFGYLAKYLDHTDNQKLSKQNANITRLRTIEAEKKNLILEGQKAQQRNVAIGVFLVMFSLIIVVWLIYKNSKKRQKITEQEKKIVNQQLEKALKDQELSALDAMIEGQEKERERLANDLHDDLGATLASLKIHFQHLKEDDKPYVLMNKTDELLEEAYQKVRSLAHAKNAGVWAAQGLIPALENLVCKISNLNHLEIEFVCHGLDQRLDNNLEIGLFRIVQELLTNILKHANASVATVYLTQHQNYLNLMVEDNGSGFDEKFCIDSWGMGIGGVKKRVTLWGGKFSIDSKKGKGTTVIIDIPIGHDKSDFGGRPSFAG